MNRQDYNRLTSDQFKGRKARTTRVIKNGVGSIPAGTVVTIARKFSGFEIETPRCSCCGVSLFVTRVEPDALDLIPTET